MMKVVQVKVGRYVCNKIKDWVCAQLLLNLTSTVVARGSLGYMYVRARTTLSTTPS